MKKVTKIVSLALVFVSGVLFQASADANIWRHAPIGCSSFKYSNHGHQVSHGVSKRGRWGHSSRRVSHRGFSPGGRWGQRGRQVSHRGFSPGGHWGQRGRQVSHGGFRLGGHWGHSRVRRVSYYGDPGFGEFGHHGRHNKVAKHGRHNKVAKHGHRHGGVVSPHRAGRHYHKAKQRYCRISRYFRSHRRPQSNHHSS